METNFAQLPGGALQFTFAETQYGLVTVTLDQIKDRASGVTAQMVATITNNAHGNNALLLRTTFSITSLASREKVYRVLQKRLEHPPWETIMEAVCDRALRIIHEPEPLLSLDPTATALPPPGWRVSPFVVDGEPTVVYGPGGVCKSYLGLFTALLVESGSSVAGLTGVHGRALILDWEGSHQRLAERARKLRAGHPDLAHANPLYRRCLRPLAEEIGLITKIVADNAITFVVIDSLGGGCAGDLFLPEPALRFYAAIRQLGVGTLSIAHIQKHTEDGDKTSIFGSVYFSNLARATWEVKRIHEVGESVVRIAVLNTKNNEGLLSHVGIRLLFHQDGIALESHDVLTDAALAVNLPLKARLCQALTAGGRTARELADELAVPLNQVKVRLSQGQGSAFVKLGGDRWGLTS